MPHFRNIDYDNVSPAEALLLRTRFHIRGGKRRLRNGRISLGIVTLYDALVSAMQWYVSLPDNIIKLQINENDNLNDDSKVYELLNRAGVIDKRFNFNGLNDLVDLALKKDMSSFDYADFVLEVEYAMISLGVMPFDENELPPDDSDAI